MRVSVFGSSSVSSGSIMMGSSRLALADDDKEPAFSIATGQVRQLAVEAADRTAGISRCEQLFVRPEFQTATRLWNRVDEGKAVFRHLDQHLVECVDTLVQWP